MASDGEDRTEGLPGEVPSNDVSVIVSALYALAADPAEWDRLLEAMTAGPVDVAEHARFSTMVAGGERVAEMTARAREASEFADATRPAIWIMSGDDRQISANDPAARSPLTALLAGREPARDGERRELFRAARARLRATAGAATVISVTATNARLPTFAYVMALNALPLALHGGLQPQVGSPSGALAIVAPSAASHPGVAVELAQPFGLTAAELRLAARLCQGGSLREAAHDLNISVNTVRNQLTAIFDKTGINRQSELVRALSELGSISRQLDHAGHDRKRPAADPAPDAEAFRLPDGRRMMLREYGPSGGRPVLVFHGGLGASLLLPGTERACERLSLRLIVPERPGIGGSDPHPDHSIAAVADDLACLAQRLTQGPMQFCSLTSGSRFAMATAERMPGAVSQILMLSPRVPGEGALAARPSRSPLVALQRRIKSHPWLADTLLAIMRMRLSRSSVARSMHANAVGPGDADWLARHPETIDRLTLALKEAMRVTSRGTSDEIRQGGALEPDMAPEITPPITVWLGAEDAYTRPADMAQWLGPRLSALEVFPAIGNYMIAKHWIAALEQLAGANEKAP